MQIHQTMNTSIKFTNQSQIKTSINKTSSGSKKNNNNNNLKSEVINRQERLKEAEEMSDSLEFSVDDYDEIGYQKILQKIIDTAIQEEDGEIQEVLLNAVADSLSHRDCVQELDLSSLSQIINALNLDCLLHGLDIIGLSRNEKYIDLIKTFLKHPISEVRETAKIALEELCVKRDINGST
jgi:hypothetical protein